MVTVSQILNLMLSTGIAYIAAAALTIIGITAITLYLMGRPNEIWEFIDEVINYLAIVGGVILAIAIINKVLIGSLTINQPQSTGRSTTTHGTP